MCLQEGGGRLAAASRNCARASAAAHDAELSTTLSDAKLERERMSAQVHDNCSGEEFSSFLEGCKIYASPSHREAPECPGPEKEARTAVSKFPEFHLNVIETCHHFLKMN